MPLDQLFDSGQPITPPPDIQRTTLGLDVLSRFVCNTWSEATANGTRQFDAVVIGAGMFGGYCADKIYRFGANNNLKVLVLDAGPFLVPTHVQNLPNAGLNVPDPLLPANDPGVARDLVWGMAWRGNVPFIGQAYCIGGKSLYWGGWCPRLLASDLALWPPSVAQYLTANYSLLEEQTGVADDTQFIQGPLFNLLKQQAALAVQAKAIANLDSVEVAPLAVQGQSPASGLFAFDKYSSVTLLIQAVREAASQPDDQRRLFVVPNAHVIRINTNNGTADSIVVNVNGATQVLPIKPTCAVILALGTIESTRLALVSFPTSPTNPSAELMGRNLMAHWRSNIFVRIKRTAVDPGGTLPNALQTAALLVRGSTGQGKFHIQVTASDDPAGNSDALLFTMIPDIDQLDSILASQQAGWISLGFRGVSQLFGDQGSAIPNQGGRWINLSPFEKDEFGIPRAYVQMTSSAAEDALANAMDTAIIGLANQLAGNNAANLQIISQGRDGLGTTYHEAGTLWMGTDPTKSVTDTNGRFHNVSNAFCADQSLFVTVGSVNPTLTGLVLSRKVAEAAVALATGMPAPA
ncbi:MAG TPA: GMC oxidoreductase [Verrucomicrobiae bacterium]|nr:GMC oxidoreductase [Verrucomicrobiae bacterium]